MMRYKINRKSTYVRDRCDGARHITYTFDSLSISLFHIQMSNVSCPFSHLTVFYIYGGLTIYIYLLIYTIIFLQILNETLLMKIDYFQDKKIKRMV